MLASTAMIRRARARSLATKISTRPPTGTAYTKRAQSPTTALPQDPDTFTGMTTTILSSASTGL